MARLFATAYPVIGFDVNSDRIENLKKGIDSTLELDEETLKSVLSQSPTMEKGLFCTDD